MVSEALDRFRGRITAHEDARSLFVALIASAALHAGLLATYPGSRGQSATTTTPATRLQARIAQPRDSTPTVLASVEPALFTVPATPEPIPTPPIPEAVLRAPAADRSQIARTARLGNLVINATRVSDRTLLGDMVDREVSEFPTEIDSLPRATDTIGARYPAAASAAGREDTVNVWFVVNAAGVAEEIVVTQGSEEFAEAVIAAIRAARFVPARNRRLPIAFPLALQFRFALDTAAPPLPTDTVAVSPGR